MAVTEKRSRIAGSFGARSTLPPGPSFRALQSYRYLRDPIAYYEGIRRRYGTLFTLPTMNGTLVVTGTAEGALELFQARTDNFEVAFGVDAVAPIVGTGSLLLLSGERHARERKLISPFFRGEAMRAYVDLIHETAIRHADRWKLGSTFPIHKTMQEITLEVILRAVFGVQSIAEAERFSEAIVSLVDAAHPAPIFFKSLQQEFGGRGPWARFMRKKRQLDALLHAHIATRRRLLEKSSAARDAHPDVLSRILIANQEEMGQMSDEDICSQLMTLLLAGHETTATSLAWVFYRLHRDARALDRAREEIATLGKNPNPADLASLPYLQAVTNEALRLHPLIGEVSRTVRERYPFQGFDIPAGVTVGASIIMIHRDPELYPEPLAFRPERFLERKYGPGEHLPFGGGHRRCVGAAFAMTEIAIVLGALLPRFSLELADDRPIATVRRNLTLAPEAGVPMTLRGRIA